MVGTRFGKLLLPLALLASVLVLVGGSNDPADATFPGTNDKIVYEREATVADHDIWVMNADGSGQTLLYAGDESVERDPVWSPDGTKIALSSDRSTPSADGPNIWVVNADGSGATQVTKNGVVGSFQPTWSPDGMWLAFERNVGFSAGPWTTSALTTTTVIKDTVNNFVTSGIDETMTVTVTGKGVPTGILSVDDADTLTLEAAIPTLGPGDTYTITRDKYEVFVIKADGTGEKNLSASMVQFPPKVYSDYAPSWSPNGDKLAFTTQRNAYEDVYTATIDPGAGTLTGLTNLTPGDVTDFPEPAYEPDWSPDASKIVLHTQRGTGGGAGVDNILWMKSDGDTPTLLTNSASVDRDAVWSPDGTKIAFSRDGSGLFWVNATSSVQAGTSFGATGHKEIEPSWGRMLKAVNDTYAAATGGSLTETAATGVLANDPGLGGNDTVTAKVTKNPTHSTAFVFNTADGSFTYTHDGSDFDDSFEYTVTDAGGNVSNTAVVTLDTPANAAPVAKDDTYQIESGGTLNVAAPGVLKNDTDVEDGIPGTAVKKTDPSHGTLTLNADGSFTYKNDGTGSTDSFTYQAKDSGGKLSNVATVTLQTGGIHTVGLVDPAQGKWYLYDEAGVQQKTFFYGNPGDFPIYGDWDCDGEETPGMYRQSDGFVYLRDSNTQGIGDIRFFFGNPGDIPLAGDFNGDGCDTVSIYRAPEQRFYIINELGKNEGGLGEAEFSYVFGNPGDKPFVGDFDGDGIETVGLHRESTGLVYFRNSHTQGNADNQFIFGDPGDRLVAGDWTGDGVFTPALFRPSNTTMFFRYTNTQGNADAQWVGGQSPWLPVSGDNGLG
jgi:VCBS repeat-containing protein